MIDAAKFTKDDLYKFLYKLKDSWSTRLIEDPNGIAVRPRVLRIGKTMTVAKYYREDLLSFNGEGVLDIEGLFESLLEAQEHFKKVAEDVVSADETLEIEFD